MPTANESTAAFLTALQENVTQVSESFLGSIPAVKTATETMTGYITTAQNTHAFLTQLTGALGLNELTTRKVAAAVTAAKTQMTTLGPAQAIAAQGARVWRTAQTALNSAFRANPIGFVVTVLQYLITALVTAYQNSETFRNIVDKAFTAIRNVAITVFNAIKNAVSVVWPYVQKVVKFVALAIKTYVQTYFAIVRTVVTTVFNAIKSAVNVVWPYIQKVIKFVVLAIKTYVQTYFTIVRTIVTTVFNAVRAVVTTVWNGIKATVTGAVNTVVAVINRIKAVYTRINDTFVRARNAVSVKIGEVVAFVKGLPGRALSALSGIGSKLVQKGKDLINGFINGIKNASGAIVSTIKEYVTDRIPGFVKDALGIGSPSKVMASLGEEIGAGLALGIESSARRVAGAMDRLTRPPTPAIARAAGFGAGSVLADRSLIGAARGSVTVNVHPSPNQSETEIGRIAAREIAWAAKR